ncbi:MAG: hypothetical protein Q4G49_14255, partial [Paracoccus sp. (in: a-proteobacteria)]|nr:hypothetical protein [Paracoccus sp. (in: a-proteobacteria)]
GLVHQPKILRKEIRNTGGLWRGRQSRCTCWRRRRDNCGNVHIRSCRFGVSFYMIDSLLIIYRCLLFDEKSNHAAEVQMQISPLSLPAAPPRVSAAQQLEQAFVENMMQHAFPRPEGGAFAGGAGEDQFASFLSREYAAVLTESLNLGFDRFIKEKDE